jgi:hypothetical protein
MARLPKRDDSFKPKKTNFQKSRSVSRMPHGIHLPRTMAGPPEMLQLKPASLRAPDEQDVGESAKPTHAVTYNAELTIKKKN